jgi:AbrB family looped-hinge helix DNA binding protein
MTVKLSSKGQLVIPQPIREEMGLRPGMTFEITRQKNKIVLQPVDYASPIDALYGKYAELDLLTALEAEHERELTGDAEREKALS